MGHAARHVFDREMMVRGVEKEKMTSRMASIARTRWPGEGVSSFGHRDAIRWLIAARALEVMVTPSKI